MTGILPIKKYATHSALNMFDEYSMLSSISVEQFTGFTAQEVKLLCEQYDVCFDDMCSWYDGLHDIVEKLLASEEIEIDTDTFQNDMVTFHCADDVLTLLVHVGYLAYRTDSKCVYIPNKEVRDEFAGA